MPYREDPAASYAERKSSKRILDYLVPLAILLALTAVFRTTELDLKLSGIFFAPGEGWKYASSNICSFLYNYGTWPAIALSILAGAAFIVCLFKKNLASYRKPAIFFVLLLALGPGLMVNTVFKGHSGRPRPRDVTVFSGSSQFQKVLNLGEPGRGQSFPSGHASMGFFLGSPYFILRRSNPGWARLFLILGLTYGCALGTVRMAQGGHFASDVLWSWGVVHLSGVAISNLLHLESRRPAA